MDWRKATDHRLSQIEGRLNGIEKADAVAEVHHSNVENRLKSIEGTLVWVVRLIIGAILSMLMAFVLSGGAVV